MKLRDQDTKAPYSKDYPNRMLNKNWKSKSLPIGEHDGVLYDPSENAIKQVTSTSGLRFRL